MGKINKFTQSEITIIIECIKANPNNLVQAFKIAARKTGRAESSISTKYYTNIRKNTKLFLLGNDQSLALNSKFIPIKKSDDLKYVMKLIVDIKPEFQKIIRDYLNNI